MGVARLPLLRTLLPSTQMPRRPESVICRHKVNIEFAACDGLFYHNPVGLYPCKVLTHGYLAKSAKCPLSPPHPSHLQLGVPGRAVDHQTAAAAAAITKFLTRKI